MTAIAAALADGPLTWQAGEHGRFVLRRDDEVFGWIDGTTVVLGERHLELRDVRGEQRTLYDTGRAARVATLRLVGHHTGRVGAVTLPRHRVRVSKVSVNPFKWELTDDLGGPQLLVGTKLFGRMRISRGADFDPDMAAGIAAVVMVLTAMPNLETAAVAA